MPRTFLTLVFLAIIFIQGLAQSNKNIELKAVLTYDRLRHPWNNDVIKKYVPALNILTSVSEDGTTYPLKFKEQRRLLFSLSLEQKMKAKSAVEVNMANVDHFK